MISETNVSYILLQVRVKAGFLEPYPYSEKPKCFKVQEGLTADLTRRGVIGGVGRCRRGPVQVEVLVERVVHLKPGRADDTHASWRRRWGSVTYDRGGHNRGVVVVDEVVDTRLVLDAHDLADPLRGFGDGESLVLRRLVEDGGGGAAASTTSGTATSGAGGIGGGATFTFIGSK